MAGHRLANKLRPVVRADHCRPPALIADLVEHSRQVIAAHAVLGHHQGDVGVSSQHRQRVVGTQLVAAIAFSVLAVCLTLWTAATRLAHASSPSRMLMAIDSTSGLQHLWAKL
jgi:hypothetical protein